jgi:hypothetical protein
VIFMHSRWSAAAFAVACLLTTGAAPAAADDATLFRVFLKDGRSLVSYGEFARVGARVVFSMPTSAAPNPPLHLVTLAEDRVDWDRTNRYAASARAAHYIDTQGENDYAALSNQIVQTLNDVALTADPARRLEIVERARKTLADWPAAHFNYRATELRQMLTMLDEAIADLRAASGGGRFDLNLSAFVELPPIPEPLEPPPTAQAVIEQTLEAARLSESPADRTSLLTAALGSLDHDAGELPADWASTTRAAISKEIEVEITIDRTYQSLAKQTLAVAGRRAKAADVRGLERLLDNLARRDTALGRQRPDAVSALVAAVETELDAARRLRLARDRYAMRAPEFRKYRAAMAAPIELFAQLKPALDDIKSLSGSSPGTLVTVRRMVARIVKDAAAVDPPDELKPAHTLLVSAAQLADNAARIRREATLAGDLARAWDASSAAAGALMLGDRARTDMAAVLRPPQLR